MMRSLYSGISGLRNHQTRLDVIGNNIANVNTTGYKTSRVVFQDIFSQTSQGGGASNPAIGIGGTNPMQIGLGIKLSSVDVMHTPSAFARSDNTLDMMIGGEGYFIVEGPGQGNYSYTRAGNFKLDDEGYLTTSDGKFVMTYAAQNLRFVRSAVQVDDPESEDPEETIDLVVDGETVYNNEVLVDVNATGDVVYGTTLSKIQLKAYNENYYDEEGVADPEWDEATDGPAYDSLEGFSVDKATGTISVMANNRKLDIGIIALAMFANPGGLEKAGNSMYLQTSSSGIAEVVTANQNGAGTVESGGLEMSNVDLATEFTDMIVTQRGFQANSRIITVSDTMLEELVNLKR